MIPTNDTFARFVDVLAVQLDDHDASAEALASRLHLSRFHCDRSSRPLRVSPRRPCVVESYSSELPTG